MSQRGPHKLAVRLGTDKNIGEGFTLLVSSSDSLSNTKEAE